MVKLVAKLDSRRFHAVTTLLNSVVSSFVLALTDELSLVTLTSCSTALSISWVKVEVGGDGGVW